MNRNIEIKARLSPAQFRSALIKASQMATEPVQHLLQTDTFFNCRTGRLKLRQFEGETGELIFYQRPDSCGPKTSSYSRTTVGDPGSLLAALSGALGIRGVIRKQRTLYLVGQTRIHLDDVESLGEFLELEVVLQPQESVATGEEIASGLMQQLGIEPTDLIGCAYIDLFDED